MTENKTSGNEEELLFAKDQNVDITVSPSNDENSKGVINATSIGQTGVESTENCQVRPNRRNVWRVVKMTTPVKRKLYEDVQEKRRRLFNTERKLKRYIINYKNMPS